MSGEFLDEPQAEDWSLRGMMQDMKTDQASVEVLVSSILTFSLSVGFCISLSKSDISALRHSVNYICPARWPIDDSLERELLKTEKRNSVG